MATDKENSNPWLRWVMLWVSPAQGWHKMMRSGLKPSALANAVFYPLVGLAALSSLVTLIYDPQVPLSLVLIRAVMVFGAFFMSCFAFFPLARVFMHREAYGGFETPFGHCYVMSLYATLALIFSLYMAVPLLDVVWAFMPVYTLFISYQGVGELKVPQERFVSTWVVTALLLLGLPFIIYEIFGLIMPLN